jgi:phosphoribosyl 1,2-cyclic phosphate phosphodiesterase
MIATLLGTGTSHGVPVLGCNCATCTSKDPFDFRTRSSVYIQAGELHILIDTATEMRLQTIKNRIPRVDMVLMTHNHADHICGFDDLRRFSELQGNEIPVYGNKLTLEGITNMFPYIFDNKVHIGGGIPRIRLKEITLPFESAGINIIPIPVFHGPMGILGYRIGDFAYVTDCSYIPEESLALLKNLKLFILGVLRFKPHPTHFNLEQGLEIIEMIKPKHSILTHIAHDFKHHEVNLILPANVELGYDGQQVQIG